MTKNRGAIDAALEEFHGMAEKYVEKARILSNDPYMHEAVVKVAVSSFVWKLYHAFDDDFGREALLNEMIEQTEALRRAVQPGTNIN